MNKKILIAIAVILGLILIGLIGTFFLWPEKPVQVGVQAGLVVTSPKINGEVSSPLKISGYANGNGWSGFEGQVGTVQLNSLQGGNINILGQAVLTATTDWTSQPTYFETTINFNPALATGTLELVFSNENASGDPARDKTFSLPIKLK